MSVLDDDYSMVHEWVARSGEAKLDSPHVVNHIVALLTGVRRIERLKERAACAAIVESHCTSVSSVDAMLALQCVLVALSSRR